jgi:CRP-like cAMP-binding protein
MGTRPDRPDTPRELLAAARTPEPRAHPPLRAAGRGAGLDAVRLLDAEPELAAAIPPAELPVARRSVLVPGLRLAPGPWTPGADLAGAIALLVIDGIIVRKGAVLGAPDAALFGPGDVFDTALLDDPSLESHVLVATQLAVLDGRLILAARRWPQLVSGLTRQLLAGRQNEHRLAVIRSLPRVEERLLALMADLAARWGRVTPAGLVVALPATHELLGRLVGARRPTVSLALAALKDQGLLRHMHDGRWLLPTEAVEWASTAVPPHPARTRADRPAHRAPGGGGGA